MPKTSSFTSEQLSILQEHLDEYKGCTNAAERRDLHTKVFKAFETLDNNTLLRQNRLSVTKVLITL